MSEEESLSVFHWHYIKQILNEVNMGRCDYSKLKSMEPVLDEIRKWKGIKEPKPGIFYLKSQGFMHFHEKDGKIWADARDGKDWGKPIDVPSTMSKAFMTTFLKELTRRYEVSQ